MKVQRLVLLCAVAAAPVVWAAGPTLDPALPKYTTVDGLRGTLNAAGSDTMLELQTLMAEEFRRLYPQVKVQVEGKGSSTAPPALIEGTVQLGDMSRKMKNTELDAFEEAFGYEPLRFDVALDTLAVFVNKDNPIESLNIEQVDSIFSKTRKCGAPTDVGTWGQLGLTGRWATAPISLYGRNAASGTYGYFKEHALCKGDFKNSVNEQPGSASVVQSVSSSLNGVGYSGIGYTTSSVRAVPLAREPGKAFVDATPENAINGSYPLSRFLYVYVNKEPGKELDPITREFMAMVLSRSGQEVVVKDGYIPLPAKVTARELAKLE